MRIGVLGYYGYGNAGDEVILENISSALEPHNVAGLPVDFPLDEKIFPRLNAYDYLILGGGGLYNQSPPSPFGNFDVWEKQLTTPIGVLGLGIENLDKVYLPATLALVERAEFFIVRDQKSKDLIGHPKVQLAPDVTFYHPHSHSVRQQCSPEAVCGVNLRPFGQGADAWLKAVRNLPGAKRAIPLTTVPIFNDRELLLDLDPNCPDQFDPNVYRDIDILVGTAFHSIVFAIQAGVPAVAISYHPKVWRLMSEIGLSDYVLGWDEHARLKECYARALEDRQSIRQHMLDYTASAQQQWQSLFQQVASIIDGHKNDSIEFVDVAPRVTIIMDCDRANVGDVDRTLASCLGQTYRNIDIVLTTSTDLPSNQRLAADTQFPMQQVVVSDGERDALPRNTVLGEFILRLTPGHELTLDAISVWVKMLAATPEADFCYSDCYITDGKWILHRLALNRLRTTEQLAATCPCFMVRTSMAAELLASNLTQYSDRLVKKHRPLHLPYGLVFRRASPAEQDCLYGAVAFARERIEQAQDLIKRASSLDQQLLVERRHQERFFSFFTLCAFSRSVSNDPVEYLETVIKHFPTETTALRRARSAFVSRASFEEAHIWQMRGSISQMQKCLARCVKYDSRWLLDRGLISTSIRSFLKASQSHPPPPAFMRMSIT